MQEEKILLNATLCFPIRDGKILLGLKAKKIGQGRWNGYGGGIEDGETPEQSILRELADREWLPVVLQGRKIIGEAYYGPFQKSLLRDLEIRYVDSFSEA